MNIQWVLSALVFLMLMACESSESDSQLAHTPEANTKNDETEVISVHDLPSVWRTQRGDSLRLSDLNGNVLVTVMIYTSCKAACPRLIADMRHLEFTLPDKYNKQTKFLFISIDPEVDTPARLKKFAEEQKMTDDHWLFLQGTKETVQEFALVLGMKYKKISPIDYSHSNIISVFDQKGVMKYQKQGLGIEGNETVAEIEKLHQL